MIQILTELCMAARYGENMKCVMPYLRTLLTLRRLVCAVFFPRHVVIICENPAQ